MSKQQQTKKQNTAHQLTSAKGYDVKRMIFTDPVSSKIPGNDKLTYRRINIKTLYPDGSYGDLILPTERLFSFGVQENVSQETKKPNGYSMPLCLYNKNGASEDEKAWLNTLNNIVERCKKHIIDNKDEIGLDPEFSVAELRKLNNSLSYPKDKVTKKIIEGAGPTLYPKLRENKKEKKFLTIFTDENGDTVDPLSLVKKYCYVRAAILIESIYLGTKLSLQVKLYEAVVEVISNNNIPLLSRPKSQGLLHSTTPMTSQPSLPDVDQSDDIEGSVPEDDDVAPSPPVVVKPAEKGKPIARLAPAAPVEEDDDIDNGDVVPEPAPVEPPKRKVTKKVTKKT